MRAYLKTYLPVIAEIAVAVLLVLSLLAGLVALSAWE